MRIARYARVSTLGQHPEAQLDRLAEYCARRGAEAVPFVDQCSGARARRPALDQLLAAAKRREIDAIAIVRLDRLARSVSHLVAVVGELEALGVALVVLDGSGLDTSTPAGRLLLHVVGAIGEFERSLIVERVQDGMRAARRRGKHLGRPRRLDPGARRRVHRLRASGLSLRAIAAALEVSLGVVQRELKRTA